MAAPSCAPTSLMKKTYDVFISFRGEDTRNDFTSHFNAALCRKKVKAYIDEDRLEKGEEISSSLLSAIQESKICVVVLSGNYASSSWCLTELAHILRCKGVNKQLVVPVFYHVDPSDIRQQRNSYAAAFAKHETRFEDEKVQMWRNSLKEAGNMCGWHVPVTRSKSKAVEEIVEDILKKLDNMSSKDDFKNLVGIDQRLQRIEQLLYFNLLDVRIIGIWGMGGIGKTTLAEVILNRFAHQFESSCLLRNIKSKPHKLDKLQKKLFSELLEEHVENVNQFVKDRLQRTKVLVILDDVDDVEQLEYLVRDRDWFGHGSRIIITTRDKQVLNNILADGIYEVDELNFDEARQLFYTKAFKQNTPSQVYVEISKLVVTKYAKGVPLALKILGCHLYSKSVEEWESELRKLENIPHDKVQNVLKISYDGLSYDEKNLFLDIAFFFTGAEQDVAKRILDSYRLGVAMGIRVLIDKSLITIDRSNRLSMHDLVQGMGIEIARQQSPDEPGERSRLWFAEDVCNVLKNNTGTKKIQGMSMDMSKISAAISLGPKVFKTMCNLKFLKFHDHICVESKLHFPEGLKYLPDQLRYLHWDNCSLKTLPLKFCPQNLVELHLTNSKLKKLWDGVLHIESLTFLNLKESENLTEIPDLSWALNLKKIDLSHCTHLEDLPSSIGKLESLQFLDLYGCSNFDKFPTLPKNIRNLDMAETAIQNVPPSIEHLSHLLVFDLTDCKRLNSLPTNFFKLKSLRQLYLKCCIGLEYLPEILEPMEHLVVFEMQKSGIRQLPLSIKKVVGITSLELQNTSIFEIPDSLFSLLTLESLDLSETNIIKIPESIKLSKLRSLDVSCCKFLQSIPELPLSIKRVNARGCTSLVMVSNSWSLLAEERTQNLCCMFSISFDGCLKLDRKNIITEFQIRALSTTKFLVPPRRKGWLKLDNKKIMSKFSAASLRTEILHEVPRPEKDRHLAQHEVLVCYPGDEIPEWFCYQNVGCSINMKLPPLWYTSNYFLGFGFCFVVENAHNRDHEKEVYLNWEIYYKTNYDYVRHYQCVLGSTWYGSSQDINQVVMTTHVDIGAFDFDALIEMSFHFSFSDPSKSIKRSGIRLLCLRDAIEFGIASVITDELQPNGFWKNILYYLHGFPVFQSRQQLCEKLLSSNIQQRYKELWLMLAWDFLPVREVVNRQMDVADTTCPLCGMILESATHLFLYCQSVRPLWFMSRWCLHTNSLICDSMASFLEMVLFGDPNSNMHFDVEFLLYASILVDAIWLARNKLIRDAKGCNIADIHNSVQAKFNHVTIQLNHHGSCNSVSRAIVKDSYMIDPYPKRAKLSDSL
ncbi:disease resistance-like protein DSC1 isoform X1 [Morus notabilis]|uniref:disease resistance-like protein DSC1 isoform X1 n=1 Tax=Morus notabilis TaxID=981085 RepID=UPI000CED56F8|nr:disease resistance-like protein DSC1 isoform X1 [Morus notabilis]